MKLCLPAATSTALLAATAVLVSPLPAGAAPRAAVVSPPGSAAVSAAVSAVVAGPLAKATAAQPLTNLSHLNFLRQRVRPPQQAGHTTYRIGSEPGIGTLWTYADLQADGTYKRIGGRTYHPETNTYDQGAYNSDDMARASVVYLRHWKQTGSASSRMAAYELLRGVMYMQTASGPNRGNVVLWMQPDGTLNPSPIVKELPDPSDSGASYWLARSVWALGEGYAAFKGKDPDFAAVLRKRLDLAIGALDRETLSRYGQYLQIDGRRTPAWLIVDGADATAEAVLGLSAYVAAGGTPDATRALRRFSLGVAALSAGDARRWPFGAILPWGLSRSVWHAWASQTPAALARASVTLHSSALEAVATKDSNVFDPWMLTSGGPDNGRLPTRLDGTQIAYGVDSRVESLVATAQVTHASGSRRLAGMTAGWYFGANAAGEPGYDPSTGRTVDGISATGDVNHNAGAESTIHGLLSMLVLDANPDIARIAENSSGVYRRVGSTALEAETAQLAGAATAVAPTSLWTGESLYGGTGYVAIGNGGSVTFTVPSGSTRLVMPVVDLRPGSTAVTTFRSGDRVLGTVRSGAVGAQGDSPAPGALLPVTLKTTLPSVTPGQTTQITATTVSSGGDTAMLDALMIEPRVSRYVLGGHGHGTALLRNASGSTQATTVSVPGTGRAQVESYDNTGRRVASQWQTGSVVKVEVLGDGYTVVRR